MNPLSKKSIVVFCCFSFIAILFVFFHHHLICYGIKHFLASSVPKHHSLHVDYESGEWKKGAYVLHHITLSQNNTEKSPAFNIKIEDLELKFSMQLFPFHFDSRLVIHSPEITLLETKSVQKKKSKNWPALYKQSIFKKNILIHQGKLIFNNDEPMQAYFSTEIGQREGKLQLAMTEEKLNSAPLVTHFSSDGKNFACHFQLEKLNLPWLFNMASFFSLPLDPTIELTKGTLTGSLAFEIDSKNNIKNAEYDLKLLDLGLNSERYGLKLITEQVRWKNCLKLKELSHELANFLGEGEFLGVQLDFKDSKTRAQKGTIQLNGKLQLKSQNELLAHFSGQLMKEREVYPLSLTGNRLIKNPNSWKLILDLFLDKKMTTSITLTSQTPNKYLFETHFKNIELDLLDLLQHPIKIYYPQISHLDLKKGTLSGLIEGVIDQNHFQSLDVKEFEMSQVLIQDDQRQFSFSADQMAVKGEFNFSKPDFFDETLWQLKLTNGSFNGYNTPHLSQVSADLAMHHQYIKPSKVTGFINGMKGNIDLEGLYTHLNLNLDLDLTKKNLFYLLGEKNPIYPSELDETFTLNFGMHFTLKKEQIGCEGNLHIMRANHELESVTFGATWETKKFFDASFLTGLSLGWFKTNHLSADIINIPLEFLKKPWRASGVAALEVMLNHQEMTLSVDPTQLQYSSSYLFLDPSYGEEKPPSCYFRYDFEKNSWIGKVPLKKAKLILHSNGIEVDSFNSELDLRGTFFDFQNVSVFSQGLSFQGRVTLDYQYNNYAKLTVDSDLIEGSTKAVQSFLSHFNSFANLNLPLEGDLYSDKGGMSLSAYVGAREEMLSWKVKMTLKNGTYFVTPLCRFKELTTRFEWSWEGQLLNLIGSDGYLELGIPNASKSYHLNIPVAQADFKKGDWNYDVRLETPTHDICRLAGKAKRNKERKELDIIINKEITRFFGAQIDCREFAIGKSWKISRLDFETDLSSRDLYHHLDFLVHAGFLPIEPTTLEEMQSPRFEGNAHLKIYLNQLDEKLTIKAKSDRFIFGTIDLNNLLIHAEKKGNAFNLTNFSAGALKMTAQMLKEKNAWKIPNFYVDWKNCQLRGEEGFFHQDKKIISLPIKHFNIDLSKLLNLLPNLGEFDHSYLKGNVTTWGNLLFDFSKGWKELCLDANLELLIQEFSKASLRVESAHPVHFHFSANQGFEIQKAAFNFFHPHLSQLWAKCHLSSLKRKNETKYWKGKGLNIVVPPEMLHHLAITRALPYLGGGEDHLAICNYPFRWDNQMDLSFDFTLGEIIEANGSLKEGYYWIGDKAWYVNDFRYRLHGSDIDLKMNTILDDHPFDLHAQVNLLPHLKTQITIQETIIEEQTSAQPLTILSNWSEKEGFFIQSIEGSVSGMDFSFHHNPRKSFLEEMVLTGQLKIDVPKFSKCLPQSMQKTIQAFEIGKGYELSGELIFSKQKLLDSYFTGYLKGKRFQLMGSEMETLMSEITIHTKNIKLCNFNLSDTSGIFTIDEIHLMKEEDQRWKISSPHIIVQDFRPSLLKKIGCYRGRIKPLNIREMSFHHIQGVLGHPKSFTGKGRLSFTNTFKRDYNILDIPFEILGRLGLDMSLLVPIRGELDYIIDDGKIHLTKLSHSHSEGKRSRFYLSPSEPSYIDLDGTVNINIKMKQYVLLKITEPFTLSIGGTFEDVRYSLK